jgi:hypothetical protein
MTKKDKADSEPKIPKGLENVPRAPTGIELEGEQQNAYGVIGGFLGLQEKDMYSVLERSDLSEHEIPVFRDLIHQASHGIGGGPDSPHDFTMPWLGETVVIDLRARRSKDRQSSGEAERVMASWINYLREQEAKKQEKANKMVGA